MKKEHLNEESKEFEDSLMRLVEFSRHGVPQNFTPRDKFHLLDLFVNNEKTLV